MKLDAQAPVRTLMATTVVSLSPSHRVWEARELFKSCSLHHLPVIDEQRRLVGIVSHTDLYRVGLDDTFPEDAPKARAAANNRVVSKLMRREPVTITADAPLELAVSILAEGAFHALPVVDDDDRLVGIITTSDILRRLLGY
ncbi:MAG: hypothetical protein CVU56_01365 [Deltaproteobacteria bacterium HGW-Deltaproteobacteria-14]|jgi:CBS domain-containing protein|nr:MAG: hypothetical protein CVU56_01365 [Deltaproteobacteria bacterium HGW-Deltaproteobacteria-14]